MEEGRKSNDMVRQTENSVKARSLSHVHGHTEDSAAVRVHVQRSRSLPSSTEPAERDRSVSSGEFRSDVPAGCAPGAEGLARSLGQPGGASEMSGVGAGRDKERARSDCEDLIGCQLLLTALQDAEMAANAAAIQLVSFRELPGDRQAGSENTDLMAKEIEDSRSDAPGDRWPWRQKALLLEKLEAFKRVGRDVRLQLKGFQDERCVWGDRLAADVRMCTLLKKLSLTETQNLNLKEDLGEKERRIEELIDLKQKEREKLDTVVQLSKSVEITRAHLQGQLRHKESENSRLTVQLRGLEKTLAEQKLQIEILKTQISSVSANEEEVKEALQQATLFQTRRAEQFESAMERSRALLREKDVELVSVRSAVEVLRQRQEEEAEVKTSLEAQVAILEQQIGEMTEQLRGERANARMSGEDLLQKVEDLKSETADLRLGNAALQASSSDLDEKRRTCTEEMQEQTSISQHQKQLSVDYQTQVTQQQEQEEDLKEKEEREAEIREMGNQTESLRSSLDMKDLIKEEDADLQARIECLQRKVEDVAAENSDLVQKLSVQEGALQCSGRQLEQRSAECVSLSRQLAEMALADVNQQVSMVTEKAAARERTLQSKILALDSERNRSENELRAVRQSKESKEEQFELRLRDLQLRLDQSEAHKQSIQLYIHFLKDSYTAMFESSLSPDLGLSSS